MDADDLRAPLGAASNLPPESRSRKAWHAPQFVAKEIISGTGGAKTTFTEGGTSAIAS